MSAELPSAVNFTLKYNLGDINEEIKRQCAQLPRIEGYCPPITTEVDNYVTCWSSTPPGTTANRSCPNHNVFDPTKYVYNECLLDGNWYTVNNNEDGPPSYWANYTQCMNQEEYEFLVHINNLFVTGYAVSLVALIFSLAIFLSFRSLKCTRIRIHIQLFLSFIMNNTMWLIWYSAVIPNSEELNEENPIWCQLVEVFLKYFLIANYMWMFCEGLYLHISLVVVFMRDEVAWIWFVLIGWAIPAIIITIYSYVRIFHFQDTKGCWLADSKAELIYSIPVCITLAVSLVFLFNVLRVIMTIMHPNSDNPAPIRVRKAARAALILIPLFGLQYILIPFRPDSGESYAHLYEYVTVVITSLQGLCVSCLFCFANQDVHHAIKGTIRRRLYTSGWHNHNTGAADNSARKSTTTTSFRQTVTKRKDEEAFIQLEPVSSSNKTNFPQPPIKSNS